MPLELTAKKEQAKANTKITKGPDGKQFHEFSTKRDKNQAEYALISVMDFLAGTLILMN